MWMICDKPKGIPSISRYHSIQANWEFSARVLSRLRDMMHGEAKAWGNDVIVGVAGSLGRFEASTKSDIDCIILTKNKALEPLVRQQIANAATELHLSLPKRDGVFSGTSSVEELLSDIGGFTEDLGVLGRRMLMLLEGFPIYNEPGYELSIEGILRKYAEYIVREGHKQFVFLMNDLIRYFREICVNYQNSFWRENEKWPLRNIKLRHSRIVMYAGLLFTLGCASTFSGDRYKFVKDGLYITPLERIAAAYKDAGDDCFFRVAGSYNIFLSRVSSDESRDKLLKLEYENRYESSLFLN